MEELKITWQDVLPVLTGGLGLVLGAMLTEIQVRLATARERRRALNVLLYDLLQLRLDIRRSSPKQLFTALRLVAEQRLGPGFSAVFNGPEFRSIIGALLRDTSGSERVKLAERYTNALHGVVQFDPILAYKLAGNERIAALEQFVGQYYTRFAQHSLVANDPEAPRFLTTIEQETVEITIDEALKQLAADILLVGRARGWWLLRRVWYPLSVHLILRRQNRMAGESLARSLGSLFDTAAPALANALQSVASTQPQQQHTENTSAAGPPGTSIR